jgi:hypothetical protein
MRATLVYLLLPPEKGSLIRVIDRQLQFGLGTRVAPIGHRIALFASEPLALPS